MRENEDLRLIVILVWLIGNKVVTGNFGGGVGFV